MARFVPALVFALLGTFACDRSGPEHVADRFVDLAIAGFDQQGALALSDGRARHLLERELRLIGGSRTSLSWQDPSTQSSIYYERGKPQRVRGVAGRQLRFPYVLTIHGQDDETVRRASVTVEQRGGGWKVVDYQTSDHRSQ